MLYFRGEQSIWTHRNWWRGWHHGSIWTIELDGFSGPCALIGQSPFSNVCRIGTELFSSFVPNVIAVGAPVVGCLIDNCSSSFELRYIAKAFGRFILRKIVRLAFFDRKFVCIIDWHDLNLLKINVAQGSSTKAAVERLPHLISFILTLLVI